MHTESRAEGGLTLSASAALAVLASRTADRHGGKILVNKDAHDSYRG